MNIQLMSDLHLEFEPLLNPQSDDADVVVLAGDIDLGLKGIAWALSNFTKPVIYVPGNHEFYEYVRPDLLTRMRAATANTHVHLLDNDSIVIDGIRFLGATLWTDFEYYETCEYSMRYAERNMADFHIIEEDTDKLFRPEDSAALFADSVEWLRKQLEHSQKDKTVVITHHGPNAKSVVPRFISSPLNPAFVSRLDTLIQDVGPALWLHGHIHAALDYQLGRTQVVCNPRGYQPFENDTGFYLGKLIEIQ